MLSRVYTNGSVMDAVRMCKVKIRLVQAIMEAIKITRRWGVDKRMIMTDALSYIVAQEETFTRANCKKMALHDLNGRRQFESN
jgi:hypothetical protein